MRLQRYLYAITALLLFTMCSNNAHEQERVLRIDYNSTSFKPIIMKQLMGDGAIIDTAKADENGVYVFHTENTPADLYSLSIDSNIIMNVALCEDKTVEICAIFGHEKEATTNSLATKCLWETQKWQEDFANATDTILSHYDISIAGSSRDTARMLITKQLQQLRLKSDSLLKITNDLLTSIPILISSYNGQKLYSISEDIDLFDKYSHRIAERYPTNRQAIALKAQVDSLTRTVLFMRRYQRGKHLPPISLMTSDSTSISLPIQHTQPYIIFFANDTSKNIAQVCHEFATTRPLTSKVFAQWPNNIQTNRKYNLNRGIIHSGDTEIMTKLQPIILIIDTEGKIKKSIFSARKADLNNLYQNLTIFAPKNNQNTKQ